MMDTDNSASEEDCGVVIVMKGLTVSCDGVKPPPAVAMLDW